MRSTAYLVIATEDRSSWKQKTAAIYSSHRFCWGSRSTGLESCLWNIVFDCECDQTLLHSSLYTICESFVSFLLISLGVLVKQSLCVLDVLVWLSQIYLAVHCRWWSLLPKSTIDDFSSCSNVACWQPRTRRLSISAIVKIPSVDKLRFFLKLKEEEDSQWESSLPIFCFVFP